MRARDEYRATGRQKVIGKQIVGTAENGGGHAVAEGERGYRVV